MAIKLTDFFSDAQVEYKLKQWEFRRNIDKATWIIIDRKIAKRKQEGKESQVIHCGKRLKQSTIDKETNRHRDIVTGNQRKLFPRLHVC